MVNFHILVKKLLKAIRLKYHQDILYAEEQKVGKSGKMYTEYRLGLSVTVEKYNEMHPGNEVNEKLYPSGHVTIPLKTSIRLEELFLYLLDEIWKKLESGEVYERGKEVWKRRAEEKRRGTRD